MKTTTRLVALSLAAASSLSSVACGNGADDAPPAEAALSEGSEVERLGTFGLALGTIASGQDARALHEAIRAAGGKTPYGDPANLVVAGFVGRELVGYAADDTRTYGVRCQAPGTQLTAGGRADVHVCLLEAVIEMSAQRGHTIGPIDTREKEDTAYVAELTGKLAAEVGRYVPDRPGLSCSRGATARCTVSVARGDMGSFEAALAGPLRELKQPEIARLVAAFFPR